MNGLDHAKGRQTLDIFIQIDNSVIERVKETVFLGVILDEHLSWKPHILSVSRKISKSIGIIYKSSFCLPKTSLRSLYYSLVYPYLTYCVSVWGSTYQSNLNRIIILQKKIIRIISKVSFDSHTGVLFREQEILKFSDIYLYQMGKFMYLFRRSLLPNYFVICLLLRARYILIIQEIPAFYIYPIVELIFENSQFGFKVLSFSIP